MQVSSTVWFHFPAGPCAMLTRHSWLKTGLPPTAVTLLAKTNDHQTRQTLNLLNITSLNRKLTAAACNETALNQYSRVIDKTPVLYRIAAAQRR